MTQRFFCAGRADFYRVHLPLPDAPTDAPPGSPAKIDVMSRRAEQGVSLFHPLDGIPDADGPSPEVGDWRYFRRGSPVRRPRVHATHLPEGVVAESPRHPGGAERGEARGLA